MEVLNVLMTSAVCLALLLLGVFVVVFFAVKTAESVEFPASYLLQILVY